MSLLKGWLWKLLAGALAVVSFVAWLRGRHNDKLERQRDRARANAKAHERRRDLERNIRRAEKLAKRKAKEHEREKRKRRRSGDPPDGNFGDRL